jgi:hypothetical protein
MKRVFVGMVLVLLTTSTVMAFSIPFQVEKEYDKFQDIHSVSTHGNMVLPDLTVKGGFHLLYLDGLYTYNNGAESVFLIVTYYGDEWIFFEGGSEAIFLIQTFDIKKEEPVERYSKPTFFPIQNVLKRGQVMESVLIQVDTQIIEKLSKHIGEFKIWGKKCAVSGKIHEDARQGLKGFLKKCEELKVELKQ